MGGDPVGNQAAARQLDHRPDAVANRRLGGSEHAIRGLDHQLAELAQLTFIGDQREHDLDLRLGPPGLDRDGGLHERRDLHLV